MLVQYDWWLDPGQSRLHAVVLRRWDFGGVTAAAQPVDVVVGEKVEKCSRVHL